MTIQDALNFKLQATQGISMDVSSYKTSRSHLTTSADPETKRQLRGSGEILFDPELPDIGEAELIYVTPDINRAIVDTFNQVPEVQRALDLVEWGGLPSTTGIVYGIGQGLDDGSFVAGDFKDPRWVTRPEPAALYYSTVGGMLAIRLLWRSVDVKKAAMATAAAEGQNVADAAMGWAALFSLKAAGYVIGGQMRFREDGAIDPDSSSWQHVDYAPLKYVAALSAWMADVLEVEEQAADRATNRRAQRAGISPRVQVLKFRRASSAPLGGTGSSKRRHLVRGHYAKRRCGPQRANERVVYIAPHVRGGQDGDPILVPRERVFKVDR